MTKFWFSLLYIKEVFNTLDSLNNDRQSRNLQLQPEKSFSQSEPEYDPIYSFAFLSIHLKITYSDVNSREQIKYMKKIESFTCELNTILCMIQKAFTLVQSKNLTMYGSGMVLPLIETSRGARWDQKVVKQYNNLYNSFGILSMKGFEQMDTINGKMLTTIDFEKWGFVEVGDTSDKDFYYLNKLFSSCIEPKTELLFSSDIFEKIDKITNDYIFDDMKILKEVYNTLKKINKDVYRSNEVTIMFITLYSKVNILLKNSEKYNVEEKIVIKKNCLLLYILTTYMHRRWNEIPKKSKSDYRRFTEIMDFMLGNLYEDCLGYYMYKSTNIFDVCKILDTRLLKNEASYAKRIFLFNAILDVDFISKFKELLLNNTCNNKYLDKRLLYKSHILVELKIANVTEKSKVYNQVRNSPLLPKKIDIQNEAIYEPIYSLNYLKKHFNVNHITCNYMKQFKCDKTIDSFTSELKRALGMMQKAFLGTQSKKITRYSNYIITSLIKNSNILKWDNEVEVQYMNLNNFINNLSNETLEQMDIINIEILSNVNVKKWDIIGDKNISKDYSYFLIKLFNSCVEPVLEKQLKKKICEKIDKFLNNYNFDVLSVLKEIYNNLKKIDQNMWRLNEVTMIFLNLYIIVTNAIEKNIFYCSDKGLLIEKNCLLLYILTTYMNRRWNKTLNMSKTDFRRFIKIIDFMVSNLYKGCFGYNRKDVKDIFEVCSLLEKRLIGSEAMYAKRYFLLNVIFDPTFGSRYKTYLMRNDFNYELLDKKILYKCHILVKLSENFNKILE